MIVKKYEARSMNEALEMVKAELGPEAIILGARDNSRRYGLVGETSVEITAAIHEDIWKKKAQVESKIPDDLRQKIHKGSAKAHRELIEKSVARGTVSPKSPQRTSSSMPAAALSPQRTMAPASKPTGPIERNQRYIDMTDEVEPAAAPNGQQQRRRVAAQKAWTEMQSPSPRPTTQAPMNPKTSGNEISLLKEEIQSLKQFFVNAEKVPQTFIKSYPGSEYELPPELSVAFEKLKSVGVGLPLVIEMLKAIQSQLKALPPSPSESVIQGLLVQEIARRTTIKKPQNDPPVAVLMGAGGHGKTTTLIKWASQLVLNEQKNIAVISTDNKKFGASEQLKIYCQILNVPFTIISEPLQWEILADQLVTFDKVLVDTAGVRFRDPEELENLNELMPPDSLAFHKHLVLSATAKDNDALEIGKRFARIGYEDVIFTALDQSSQHGVLMNFQNALRCPFHSFGIGSQVPEDFEYASVDRILDLILGYQRTLPHDLNGLNDSNGRSQTV